MSDEIPKTQRALIFREYNGPLTVEEVPVPEPKDDEILIKINFSGICHSDLHGWLGDFHFMCQLPVIGGHEGSGQVVKVGEKVKDWKIGERAGIKVFNNNCLSCEFCKRGHETSCPAAGQASVGFMLPGTFEEYICIRALDAIRISEGTDMAGAAPILCAGVTVYKALKESGVQSGQIVAITGAGGGLGSFAIQYAKAMGMRVVAIDHSSKEDHCKSLGAEWFVDGFSEELVITVKEITSGGAHGVLNFAVNNKAMEQTVQYVRPRGTVVFVALPKESKITVDTLTVIFSAITIKGSLVGSRQDTDEAMGFISRGIVKVPYKLVRLDQVPEVFQQMIDGTITSRCIVDFSL